MSNTKQTDPFTFLEEFRGKEFSGELPTIPEMFNINVKRYPNNACFSDFEGPGGSKNTLTYSQVHEKIITLANWFAANGVVHGDRIAVTGKNSPEWGNSIPCGVICRRQLFLLLTIALHDA